MLALVLALVLSVVSADLPVALGQVRGAGMHGMASRQQLLTCSDNYYRRTVPLPKLPCTKWRKTDLQKLRAACMLPKRQVRAKFLALSAFTLVPAPTRRNLPVAPPATPELHKAAESGPSDDADENMKNKVIPEAHLSLSGSSDGGAGTYGVLRAAGGALGLNAMAQASAKDKKAKPLNQAVTKFLTAKNPKTAWSHAIVLVSIIGGSVVTLTAIGTYFIASAEAKRLKKAKKKSNLLAGR
jgi:hypothetical protein